MTIAILLLLSKKTYCNTITIAASYCNTIAITIGSIFCLKKTNKFVKISVLTMSVVEILLNATNMPEYFNKMN